ncbi:sister chromatid cohesion factor (Chl12) [Cordyceps militaris]|uniref:Sister chromatid cohesion factor (Chl12) n=1 Tax=Cordyceps militaris TaxID=73501 RepID=A0A2H4SAT8_CORMI|nr:sister chromatid cohesion factor (Chl12) [Cordyceps militaris]
MAQHARKRDQPHDTEPAPTRKTKTRTQGPFVDDDDDSTEECERSTLGPPAKRPMREQSNDDSEPRCIAAAESTPTVIETAESVETEEPADVASNLTQPRATPLPVFSGSFFASLRPTKYDVKTCNGKAYSTKQRQVSAAVSYDHIVAARSKTKEGRAKRSYYGIDIHELMNNAKQELAEHTAEPRIVPDVPRKSTEQPEALRPGKKNKKYLLWTEKYRARSFMDLCGDDGTNRIVLRWLKRWDPVVFPGAKPNYGVFKRLGSKLQVEEEKPHRRILLLTGPPGLGKTTLAHVCARQAGYEVLEINASDDRSRDVVKNRIRTSLGTENVKNVANLKDSEGHTKAAKPVCVIVDEVDGVVSGSGASGEGGFIKALIDLVLLDQKNSAPAARSYNRSRKKKRGDDFRMMRPLVLICNDVYHPSLRPLRQSNLAEIVHVGRPSIDAVVARLKAVFEKEGIPCDKDASRKLCEAAWGMTSGIDARRGAESTVEGDLRGVMVVGEWVAARFRSTSLATSSQRLTRQWIESHILNDLSSGAAGARGLGRGNVRDIVSRLFQEGGGFPKQAMDLSVSKNTQHEQPKTELGFNEQVKKHGMDRLRQMVETSGEISYIMTEIMAEYPNRDYNDDLYLSKPNQAYEWLFFHDACQSRLFASQEWELSPYLSQPVLACHHLFASPRRHYAPTSGGGRWGADAANEDAGPPVPFSGPRADYQAREAEKHNRAALQAMQSQLPASLMRSFRSAEDMATDLLPYLARLTSPDVQPVLLGGTEGVIASVRKESERIMVKRAAEVLAEIGIDLVKGRLEGDTKSSRAAQWVYRMEPDIDALASFETGATLLSAQVPTRYAVRQVLDQELRRTLALRESHAREARFQAGGDSTTAPPSTAAAAAAAMAARLHPHNDKENTGSEKKATAVRRDFFGRIIEVRTVTESGGGGKKHKVWVTYHEGLNNAVRKPISVAEFLKPL